MHAGICMSHLAKLASRYIGEQGFSIGITDVTPADVLVAAKEAVLSSNYRTCSELVRNFQEGVLDLLPGCDADQSLEVPFCSF
jgi:DNA-directed RNA polymerase III subunit RPC1